MREVLIVLLVAAAGYLAYDDFYKQRPALQQAQAEIQQSREQASAGSEQIERYSPRVHLRAPASPAPPGWFQKHLEESSSSLDTARQHTQKGERANPKP
jgi:hypothetical protein